MPRYVALLRAINVGGRRVRMAQLREAFEGLGFTGVETFIASGNVIFDSPRRSASALEAPIEAGLQAALGYDVPALVRTPAALRAVVRAAPFAADPADAAQGVFVIFLREALDVHAAAAVRGLDTPIDSFHPSGREVYWWCRGPVTASRVTPTAMGRALGRQAATTRNITMLKKLVATL